MLLHKQLANHQGNVVSVKSSLWLSIVSKPILLLSFFINIFLLAPSIHLLQVYDRVLMSQSVDTLIYITIITVVALVFYAIGETVRSRIATRIANGFITEYADNLFYFLVHDRANSLDSNKVLKDLNTVKVFLAGRQYIAVHDLPFFPIFLGFLFLLHFTLGVVAVVGVIIMVGIAIANSLLSRSARQKSNDSSNEASTFSLAVMRRTDDIRAMGLLPSIMERWGGKTADSLNAADQAAKSAAFFYGLSRLVRQVLQVLVMAWGAGLVLTGDMSGGMMFAASMLLGKTLQPIEQIIGGWDAFINFGAAYNSIKAASIKVEPLLPLELPEATGHLGIENVVFHPGADNGHKPIVDDVSFALKPGQIMAVMGPSGAGKSTIARMIVGASAPTSGCIRLDGFDIAQWPEQQRGNAIGYVPQDILLFPGSIAENISRLETNASDEAIVHAAKLAGVHELIAGFPEGYNTLIGPDKTPLSGGQRQRIALARAFYSDPTVLVLDEPNAHLDSEGEKIFMDSLMAAKQRNVAILVVSQRQSIMNVADRMLVIKSGRIASQKYKNPELQVESKKAVVTRFHQDTLAGSKIVKPSRVPKVSKNAEGELLFDDDHGIDDYNNDNVASKGNR